jgi:hypothetical protein
MPERGLSIKMNEKISKVHPEELYTSSKVVEN